MRKVIFCIFISLLPGFRISAENSTNKIFEKTNEDVSAEILVEFITSGYEIALDSCTILGRLDYHGTIQKDLKITNSTFLDVCNFADAIFWSNVNFERSEFKDSVRFDRSLFVGKSQNAVFARFGSAVFHSPSNFSYIHCVSNISFSATVFKQAVTFTRSRFEGLTYFTNTKFEGYTTFTRMNMTEYIEFGSASFSGKFYSREKLYSGSFEGSKLISPTFRGTDLSNILLELDSISEYAMRSLALAKGLRNLKYRTPLTLTKIKSYFRQNHYRQQERDITCAIKRHDQNWIEEIVFDYTSEYGSNFWRPIQILGGLWLTCSIIYLFLFRFSKKSRLMITVTSFYFNRVRFVENDVTHEFLPHKWLSNIRYAFFFSLLSTFNIGFRDFNFSRLVRLLLTKEMDFRPTGALRTISAIQAIFSVFLIGIWILSYFGRPFD